ncbi:hypothetical protein F5Y18DRAFT_416299 [Xylariaceae sp. FL1019]|nr:hypothetical protein F5Y18DRAFT_416299 [Xylariaceae sp. FL1019]
MPLPWIKDFRYTRRFAEEDEIASQFFEKYVMYPCNSNSLPGFLEHLPVLFHEARVESRKALRCAVLSASYASIAAGSGNSEMEKKALELYGEALCALGDALKSNTEPPDGYVLMTIVVLDIFETVYLGQSASDSSHAEGMKLVLRLRGPNQIYGPRGWSLFRLAHHRLLKQQLAYSLDPMPESELWLGALNEDLPHIRGEKDNYQIIKTCSRARQILIDFENERLESGQVLEMVNEMHRLDRSTTTWRNSTNWAYQTRPRGNLFDRADSLEYFPDYVQIHPDVWIAYEWNYHRTARVILHEQLLGILDRLSPTTGVDALTLAALQALKDTSTTLIQSLTDEILSTVPQMLGIIDHNGESLSDSRTVTLCQGVGGYLLLWPIRVIKETKSAQPKQKAAAQSIFERIRENTRMKDVLGDMSDV